jgi:transcriptional regulator with GAF, ATPase, and Fis domain
VPGHPDISVLQNPDSPLMKVTETDSIELERQVFHLQTLYEIARALSSCRESSQIYKEVLSILTGTLGVELGFALVANDNAWGVAAARGLPDPTRSELERRLSMTDFHRLDASGKYAALQGMLAEISEVHFNNGEAVWLEFPGRDHILGGLFLGSRLSGEPYLTSDRELLSAAATHTTTALENVLLTEELREAQQKLQLENIALREEVLREYEGGRIIGQSESIIKILKQIKNIAKSPTNVLIYGETGTGKELIAKTIHYLSPRKDQPFVAVNCTAIPENLVESELFGIEAGVATGVKKHLGYFEQADGGTIFIDEIGDMPLSSQAKILRAVQELAFRRVGGSKETHVDVRVLAATNKKLDEEMRNGNFREDLYFRLSVLELHLPPLRNRRDDIPLLLSHFIKKIEEKLSTKIRGFSGRAMKLLTEYDWPGNVRELENEVERAMTLAGENALIQPDDLSPKINTPRKTLDLPTALSADSLREAVNELETHLICDALEKYHWNKSAVARKLGLSRLGLQKKLDRLGIHADGARK